MCVCVCVCVPKHICNWTFFLSFLNICAYVLRGMIFKSERKSVIFDRETTDNSQIVVGCHLASSIYDS